MQLESMGKIIANLLEGSQIRIHTCFNVTVPAKWGFENRINSDFHMVYIKGGQGYYSLADGQAPFEKGKIIFVSAGAVHSAVQDPKAPPQIIPVRFGIYDANTKMPVECPIIPFSIAYRPKEMNEYRSLFEKLYQGYIRSKLEHMQLYCGSILAEILTRMYDELLNFNEGDAIDFRIDKVRLYMEQNPLSRLTNDELAAMAGLTEKYFRKLFKQQTGFTPKEYQIRTRIGYSRFLLEEGTETIKSVAAATGYPDPYTFSKQFKKVLGFSPRSLKKNLL